MCGPIVRKLGYRLILPTPNSIINLSTANQIQLCESRNPCHCLCARPIFKCINTYLYRYVCSCTNYNTFTPRLASKRLRLKLPYKWSTYDHSVYMCVCVCPTRVELSASGLVARVSGFLLLLKRLKTFLAYAIWELNSNTHSHAYTHTHMYMYICMVRHKELTLAIASQAFYIRKFLFLIKGRMNF